jgi:hypothetical protein
VWPVTFLSPPSAAVCWKSSSLAPVIPHAMAVLVLYQPTVFSARAIAIADTTIKTRNRRREPARSISGSRAVIATVQRGDSKAGPLAGHGQSPRLASLHPLPSRPVRTQGGNNALSMFDTRS